MQESAQLSIFKGYADFTSKLEILLQAFSQVKHIFLFLSSGIS